MTATSDTAGQPVEVDLTKVDAKPRPTEELVSVEQSNRMFEQKIRGRQEWVRTALAVGAFLSLVVILVVLLAAVWDEIKVADIEKISAVLITPLTGIVGTIIGFYFAEKRSGGSDS